jgi:hypothetical protein
MNSKVGPIPVGPMSSLRSFKTAYAIFVLLFVPCMSFAANSNNSRNSTAPTVPSVYVVEHGTNSVVIQRDGKNYLVDLDTRSVREMDASSTQDSQQSSSTATAQEQTQPPAAAPKDTTVSYYIPGDERLFTLPSGQRLQRHGMTVSFTHRFVYDSTFKGPAQGSVLGGLDGVSVSSFGFKYALTNRLAVSAFRSPSLIGRPIELMASYLIAEERTGAPFGAMFRFSVDGQDDFRRNYTTNFEGIFSRSITSRAALYLVPTLSLHNRPVLGLNSSLASPPAFEPCDQALANNIPASMNVRPCANTFSLGVGLAVDVRPTVALIAEVNPTLANARELGRHRAPFSFAIQKKIFRHSFTFGFTTAPGSTVAQRSGTRSTFLRTPNADTPSGLFIGFNLSRQLH